MVKLRHSLKVVFYRLWSYLGFDLQLQAVSFGPSTRNTKPFAMWSCHTFKFNCIHSFSCMEILLKVLINTNKKMFFSSFPVIFMDLLRAVGVGILTLTLKSLDLCFPHPGLPCGRSCKR